MKDECYYLLCLVELMNAELAAHKLSWWSRLFKTKKWKKVDNDLLDAVSKARALIDELPHQTWHNGTDILTTFIRITNNVANTYYTN